MGGWLRLAQVRARSKLRLPPPEDSPPEVVVDGVWAAGAALGFARPPGRRVEVEKGKFGYNNIQILAAKFKFA